MKISGLRWWVVSLVALATVINYIDRQTLSVLWPDIAAELYPDHSDQEVDQIYGFLSVVFIFSYAFGQAIFGKIFDWIGTRLGFALSIGVWSMATVMHAFARGIVSFSLFRGILGIAEAGNWPGAAKANAEWFPTKERAFAQGIFNSGAAIGGLVSIPIIGILSIHFSWHIIFIIVGTLGFLWLIPWWVLVKSPPKQHKWLTEKERDYILTGQLNQDLDQDGEPDDGYAPGTGELLSRKQSWGVIIASAAIDPIWWLFIVWIQLYLNRVFDMDVKELALYAWVPYAGAMLGAWFGGLLAQNRMKAGWTVNATRKLVITLGCMIMLPALLLLSDPGLVASALFIENAAVTTLATIAVLIMAVILFGFQTAIGNVQTLPSDFFSGKSVGTLSGFAGMAAKLGAAGLTFAVPVITAGSNYAPVFIIGAVLALTATAAVWLLCGDIKPLSPRSSEEH